MKVLEFLVLGPLEVVGDAGVIKLGGRRQRAVLAILLLEANRVVPVEQIADGLYGEAPPATAVAQVRDHVSQLRRLLGQELLETHAPGYLLRVEPNHVDGFRFERMTEEALAALSRDESEAASDLARRALAMWRGPPFADFAHEPFAQPAIARLEAARLRAIEGRIEAELSLGNDGDLVAELEELTRAHPLREQLRAQLMLALYRSGRQAEALAVFHETRSVLRDELGLEVSPALRDLAGRLLRHDPSLDRTTHSQPPSRDAAPTRNPYKGLSAFAESDARDFFGREELSRRLVDRLRDGRFIAVVGPSGSGKSSLVRAGLLPLLRDDAIPGSAAWPIVEMNPGSRPLEELEAALLRVAVNPPGSLMDQLADQERGLCRVLKRVLPADGSELVLLVDQLEELFVLTEDEQERSHFLSLLDRAIRDPQSRLRLVVTLRADFYDRPLRHREFADLLQGRVLSVSPLSPEELERAIAAPAVGVGISLEQGLLTEIVADVLHQPGALPLLQYALTELFDRRDGDTLPRSAYKAIGGVSGAVGVRADQVYANLPEPGRVAARQMFLQLVAVGEHGAATRRPASLAELGPDVTNSIEAFGASRLLLFDADPRTGDATVEIAHEALITEWGLLRSWIDAAQDDIRTHHRLSARAAEWHESARDPSFLLRGTQLAQLESWAHDSGLTQSDLERDFLQASVAEEETRRIVERNLERRAVRRLRALVAVLAIAAVVAVAVTIFALDQSHRSQQQARIATARQLAAASIANLEVDPELSILLGIEAVRKANLNGAPLPDAVEALHRAIAASRAVLTIRTPAAAAVAVSPDGSRIVSAGSIGIAQVGDQEAASPEAATKAFVWDARTGRRVLSLAGMKAPVHDVAFSPDGSLIVTGDGDGAAVVWDARTGKRLFTLTDPDAGGGFLGVSFSPNGKLLATSDGVGRVRIWRLGTRRVVRTIQAGAPLGAVAWNPGGRLIGAGQLWFWSGNFSFASATRVWDARTGRLVFRTSGQPAISALRFSPDGRDIVTPTLTGTAEIWSIAERRRVAVLTGHSGQVAAVAYSPDGKLVATGGTDGTARVWDSRTGRQLLVLAGDSATVDAVAFTPDGRKLVTGSEDGTVRVWNVTSQGSRDWLTLMADRGGVASVTFPSERRLLTSGSCDNKLKLWSARNGALISTSSGRSDHGCGVLDPGTRFYQGVAATSPDGSLVAQAGANGTVQLLDAGSGRLLRTLPGGHAGVQSIVFDRTGAHVATGNWDGTAIVWDTRSGAQLRVVAGQRGIVEAVAFSPDGKTLATGGEDTTAQLWNIATGERLLTLTGHTFALTGVTFSPSGDLLATSSADGTVRVYVLPVAELLTVARTRLTRTWSSAECRTYLGTPHCPRDERRASE
jgi:WD40 repeat protein/DNA-binding SARP family transcriptional activator